MSIFIYSTISPRRNCSKITRSHALAHYFYVGARWVPKLRSWRLIPRWKGNEMKFLDSIRTHLTGVARSQKMNDPKKGRFEARSECFLSHSND